jgi:ubiquinone biosynthesis protein
MLEQVGPKRLWQELRNQAPYYAKILPQLPRLLHDRLLAHRQSDRDLLEQLLVEQRRTQNLMRALIYLGLGFVASLLALQVWIHLSSTY